MIIDPSLTGGRDPLWVAERALEGGATAIQLRDKERTKGDVLGLAQRLLLLCNEWEAALIINDHADLAMATGAHGAHMGQKDLPVKMARNVLRPWQIVGNSTALVDEAIVAFQENADYIAVGAMFKSSSKQDTRPAGPETLREIREIIPKDGPPLIAIGGITIKNVGIVRNSGADGICVISEVAMASDPARAARALLRAFRAQKR